jgi:hypothetical protein
MEGCCTICCAACAGVDSRVDLRQDPLMSLMFNPNFGQSSKLQRANEGSLFC